MLHSQPTATKVGRRWCFNLCLSLCVCADEIYLEVIADLDDIFAKPTNSGVVYRTLGSQCHVTYYYN